MQLWRLALGVGGLTWSTQLTLPTCDSVVVGSGRDVVRESKHPV